MEEKIFDLLTILHNNIKDLKEGQRDLKFGQKEIDNRLKKIETVVENDLDKKFDISIEGYNQVYDKLHEHDHRFDSIDRKIDDLSMRMNNQEAKFDVLEGGKKKTL